MQRLSPFAVVAACVVLLGVQTAGAAVIVGGSSLLSPAYANQLESWLGEGPITLTNIYTKPNGASQTAANFHSAVDGMGRTFSVLQVLPGTYTAYPMGSVTYTTPQIIGGYNPQSWASDAVWHMTWDDADRTAFIFNLTRTVKQDQQLATNNGAYQTYNYYVYGPFFGVGYDLVVTDYNLTWGGSTSAGSYGPTSNAQDILTPGAYGTYNLHWGTIEIFTIANAAVPEPATVVIWPLLGAIGWLGLRVRRHKRFVRNRGLAA